MALGKERVRDMGPCSHPFILGTLAKLHLPGVPSPARDDKGAVLWPKTCFGLGSTFPCTFPPSTILSVHPFGTVLVPRRTLPSPPKCCRKPHTSQTPLGGPKRLKELICNTSGQQCWCFFWSFLHLKMIFALKTAQHLAGSYWSCFISKESHWRHLSSYCTI